ncbi:Glycosyltransferase, GT2 family [Nocardioides exalbidus]|uniref:Glycosyltransferase, GT2 family n=1 Tax=Nocardioides exalbidus TaxID=402596 RepID=A0A1H4Y7L9_9ACTN|nr:galactosyltransferase-related protein [Nocardioides exalbidus]SED13270.1 Glycosyltransferase, GT2 family [Nocardioides exalbidus]
MSGVAVVTIAHGRHEHLAAQHLGLASGTELPDSYVVVAMDDPGITEHSVGSLHRTVVHHGPTAHGGLPLAAARNLGVRRAIEGGADVVVLLDVDCLPGAELVAAYADVVGRRPESIWSGPVTYLPPPPPDGYPDDPRELEDWDDPHPARPMPDRGQHLDATDPDLFWSLSFATHRATWERTGGFCEDYVGYGGEDTDFARTAIAAGVGLGWIGDARAYHQHHPVSSPPVEHLNDILRNGRIYAERWGQWPMAGWLQEFERLGLVRRVPHGWARTTASTISTAATPAPPP